MHPPAHRQQTIEIALAVAHPAALAVQRQAGDDQQIEFMDTGSPMVLFAQFGLGLQDAQRAGGQVAKTIQAEKFEMLGLAIGHDNPFAVGPHPREKRVGGDFAAKADIAQHGSAPARIAADQQAARRSCR